MHDSTNLPRDRQKPSRLLTSLCAQSPPCAYLRAHCGNALSVEREDVRCSPHLPRMQPLCAGRGCVDPCAQRCGEQRALRRQRGYRRAVRACTAPHRTAATERTVGWVRLYLPVRLWDRVPSTTGSENHPQRGQVRRLWPGSIASELAKG